MEAISSVYASLRAGDWARARILCLELLGRVPGYAPAHHALALSFCGEGAFQDAIPHLERAIDLPGDPRTFVHDLAIVYAAVDRWADAARLLGPRLGSLDDEALVLFVAASAESGDPGSALAGVRQRHPEGWPDSAPLLAECGRAIYACGDLAAAERVLRRAVTLDPANARARDGLAMICERTGRSHEALEQWTACVRLQPGSGRAHLRLAMALADKGRVSDAAAERREAMRLGLTGRDYSTALYLMMFDPSVTAAGLLHACRGAFAGTGAPAAVPPRRRSSRRRLRIGYCSGEFTLTPAYYFIRPFLRHHDRRQVDVVLYNTNGRDRIRPPAYLQRGDTWRDISRSSDDEVLSTIESDGLDVLVDLSGHFPDNRLPVFARRPVAIQATFPNYPCTTGCPGIPYLFTDIWTSPSGSEPEYAETLYRLPSGYLVYTPPAEAPPVSALPAARNGYVTFGVMQRASKLSPAVWDGIAEVLRRTRTARLLLHYGEPELDDPASPVAEFLRRQLRTRGIDPARLLLRGRRSLRDHLDLFTHIDIALDTFPYGGQTTTAESLWMGVPVIARTGRTNVSRVSAGLLRRAGLEPFVTESDAAYVDLACEAAGDPAALAALRASLRDRVRDAGLTDGRRLAREMEAAYRTWTCG